MPPVKKTDNQIKQDKQQEFMKMIARKASYFRSNPHRWAAEMGVHLKLFQKDFRTMDHFQKSILPSERMSILTLNGSIHPKEQKVLLSSMMIQIVQ